MKAFLNTQAVKEREKKKQLFKKSIAQTKCCACFQKAFQKHTLKLEKMFCVEQTCFFVENATRLKPCDTKVVYMYAPCWITLATDMCIGSKNT